MKFILLLVLLLSSGVAEGEDRSYELNLDWDRDREGFVNEYVLMTIISDSDFVSRDISRCKVSRCKACRLIKVTCSGIDYYKSVPKGITKDGVMSMWFFDFEDNYLLKRIWELETHLEKLEREMRRCRECGLVDNHRTWCSDYKLEEKDEECSICETKGMRYCETHSAGVPVPIDFPFGE